MAGGAALSADELRTVHVVIVVCNSLSIFGCAFILWRFLRSGRSGRSGFATSMSQRMVVTLSLLEISYSFPKVFAPPDETTNKLACDAQGFALEFTGLMCASTRSGVWPERVTHTLTVCMYGCHVTRSGDLELLHGAQLVPPGRAPRLRGQAAEPVPTLPLPHRLPGVRRERRHPCGYASCVCVCVEVP